MKISVTQEHIDKGDRRVIAVDRCMVALALRSAGFPDAVVGVETANLNKLDRAITLPIIVQRAIEDFSVGRKVVPFDFELEVPA